MAKKRTSLDSILPPPEPAEQKKVARAKTPQATAAKETSEPLPPAKKKTTSRKQLALYLESPVYQQLRTIAFEEETKMHRLLLEGLDRVFADRGLKSIVELLDKHGE